MTEQPAVSRRDELLELAATMFAERGLRATTVRDIADSAGILSGSLYHHFKSKEQMVEEVLRDFLDWLFDRYQEIVDTEPNPLERLKGLFMASFEAIEHRHAQVVIYQDEAKRLSGLPQFDFVETRNKEQRKMWLDLLNQGVEQGYFRPDIDVDLVYRFIRDTTWVSVRWYQPGGPLTAEEVGRQYLSIVLGGITPKKESTMPEAYVIDAVRTAVGKRNGSLAGVHPIDLGAAGWRGLFDRVDVDPGAVDDVIAGCVDAIGGQAGNIARLSWLAAGYPEEVPGVTVDRQCGSSQQAISFGAQAIMSGTADLIVAGGMQNMSQIPISSAMIVAEQFGFTSPTNESKSWLHRYGDQEISQFRGAELIAEKWNISREEMEEYSLDQPPACAGGDPRRALRERDHPGRRVRHRRGSARHVAGEDGGPEDARRRRPVDRRDGQPDLRRCQRGAARLGAGRQGPRSDAASTHPPHQRARCRSGVHADRARSPRRVTRWRRPA